VITEFSFIVVCRFSAPQNPSRFNDWGDSEVSRSIPTTAIAATDLGC
jgi:hypothetical protein